MTIFHTSTPRAATAPAAKTTATIRPRNGTMKSKTADKPPKGTHA
jgi:hypothetical protein